MTISRHHYELLSFIFCVISFNQITCVGRFWACDEVSYYMCHIVNVQLTVDSIRALAWYGHISKKTDTVDSIWVNICSISINRQISSSWWCVVLSLMQITYDFAVLKWITLFSSRILDYHSLRHLAQLKLSVLVGIEHLKLHDNDDGREKRKNKRNNYEKIKLISNCCWHSSFTGLSLFHFQRDINIKYPHQRQQRPSKLNLTSPSHNPIQRKISSAFCRSTRTSVSRVSTQWDLIEEKSESSDGN